MKNYLFAPFKNDDEKIDAFNYLDKNLDHSELILFMGRLESYYDCIMTHLKSEKMALNVRCEELKERVKEKYSFKEYEKLRVENKELKAENSLLQSEERKESSMRTIEMNKRYELKADNDKLQAEMEKEHDAVEYWMKKEKELKAEIKRLNRACLEGSGNIIKGLKAEISQLKADITHDAKVCEDYDDGLLAEIKELKAEIRLDEGVILARNKEIDELKAENKRLNNCSDPAYVEILERGYKKEIRELKAEYIRALDCGGINDNV